MSKPIVSIDKISVCIAGKNLELTLAEARELKRVLDEVLDPTVIHHHAPIVLERYPVPNPWTPAPMWSNAPVFGRPQITC